MQSERRRAVRQPFTAAVEVTNTESGVQLKGTTNDLSLFGSFTAIANPFPHGTRVRLRISSGGKHFAALGRVAYAHPGRGMAVVFSSIEPQDQAVLDEWLARGWRPGL